MFLLGPDPDDFSVTLVRGSGWWARLEAVVSATDPTPLPFEVGDDVTLEFGATSWAATIAGNVASWSKDATAAGVAFAAVEAVHAASRPDATLWFTRDGIRVPWAMGPVLLRG